MLRHATAPARFFSQVPNDIIRHPRLSANAVRLLTWQLSLAQDAGDNLSRTAERAGIGKRAFQLAKAQLRDEGYLHEWTEQTANGYWTTAQLVSNVPLTPQQALAVRRGQSAPGTPPAEPAAPRTHPADPAPEEPRPAPPPDDDTAAVAAADSPAQDPTPPSAAEPTAGEPTGRAVGRQPQKNTEENTPNQPRRPVPRAAPELPHAPEWREAEAASFLHSLAHIAPRLALPAHTARAWAPLTVPWLTSGLSTEQIQRTLTDGLDTARSPLGALRWRLEHALPDIPFPGIPSAAPAASPPAPRLAGMRECSGTHTQPRLFTPPPGTDEDRCPDCRRPDTSTESELPTPGLDAFRAARAATRRTA